ncbi:hypothetical protein LWI29_017088 [Acer saccharum]|uniref:Uncharacterized protein n=1 Tax=Acer saccharum TaxID=4024 RepID=A0AA39VNM0_ACESA|nr:hypothetical protein LWI29_017088 [Acer saccharum]
MTVTYAHFGHVNLHDNRFYNDLGNPDKTAPLERSNVIPTPFADAGGVRISESQRAGNNQQPPGSGFVPAAECPQPTQNAGHPVVQTFAPGPDPFLPSYVGVAVPGWSSFGAGYVEPTLQAPTYDTQQAAPPPTFTATYDTQAAPPPTTPAFWASTAAPSEDLLTLLQDVDGGRRF